jgi:hypothetical protein
MTNKSNFNAPKIGRCAFWIAGLLSAIFSQITHAETPAEFARNFAEFKFVYHTQVQDPDVFLQTKSGDCDDYATLAAAVLKKSGYTPRLFAVRMKGETHVVCYVPEKGSYLDYNNRAATDPLVSCGDAIQTIAIAVIRSQLAGGL